MKRWILMPAAALLAACGSVAIAPCDEAGTTPAADASDGGAEADDAAAPPEAGGACLFCDPAVGLINVCTQEIFPQCIACEVCHYSGCTPCDAGPADAASE